VIPFKFLRINQEEVHVTGNEGQGDVRVINSYPSKIGMQDGVSFIILDNLFKIIRILK
jgi:hypothetical protein